MWRASSNVPAITFVEFLKRLAARDTQAAQDFWGSGDHRIFIFWTRATINNSIDLSSSEDYGDLSYAVANLSSWSDAIIDDVFELS